MVQQLNLPIVRHESLIIYPFSSKNPKQKTYSVVSFKLANISKPDVHYQIEALVIDNISPTKMKVFHSSLIEEFLANKQSNTQALLISSERHLANIIMGAESFWGIYKQSTPISRQLYAIETNLGLTLSGVIHPLNYFNDRNVSVNKIECHSLDCNYQYPYMESDKHSLDCNYQYPYMESDKHNFSLCCNSDNDFRNLWDLDCMGICDDKLISNVDKQIIIEFEKQLEYDKNKRRYVTGLLWKEDCEIKTGLSNNFLNAKKQFDNLKKRLAKDKWVNDEYKKIINEQIQLGIVEETTRSENEYFAPHRAVIRTDKQTSRVRVVFNCSSKVGNYKSLNECLMKGPSLVPIILDVILKFRMHKFAFCADIEKAFLMIGIKENDCNYLKFVWFDENDDNKYKLLGMRRLPFGCNCSSFILAATIKKHIKGYKETNPEAFKMLNTSFYVDDLIYGSSTADLGYQLTKEAIGILDEANMKLRKFSTNCVDLNKKWVQDEIFKNKIDDNNAIHILGLNWNKFEDKLSIEIKSIIENLDISICTKRYILHTAAKFFDPLGIISPFLIRIKCLLQKIWIQGKDWDEQLDIDLKRDWIKWCSEINDLLELKIDRYLFSIIDLNGTILELHIFSDASPMAYGCIAYFKTISEKGKCNVSILLSKAKVAPLKKLTLPRMELMGAVIAARLGKYISNVYNELKFKHIIRVIQQSCCIGSKGVLKNGNHLYKIEL